MSTQETELRTEELKLRNELVKTAVSITLKPGIGSDLQDIARQFLIREFQKGMASKPCSGLVQAIVTTDQ